MSLRQPKRYPVKFYSWQDTGAPQLSNNDGVIKTILKACLVTGYGDKESAGWQMPFEDDYRMVLKMPMRTGNPPDFKIENGTVNGVVKHRIIGQDNPTSLEDTNELVAYNLLAKDNRCGNEWYVFATEFAVMLCYQMGVSNVPINNATLKQSVLYLGAIQKLNDAENDYFVIGTYDYTPANGESGSVAPAPITDNNFLWVDVRNKRKMTSRHFLSIQGMTETQTGDWLAQPIWMENKAKLPFYCALCDRNSQSILNQVKPQSITIQGRGFFRYVNMPSYSYIGFAALYVPMDYWEL